MALHGSDLDEEASSVLSTGTHDDLLSFYDDLSVRRDSERSHRERISGRVLERLSIVSFRDDPRPARGFHTKAKNHYYWSTQHLSGAESPLYQADARFDHGRTLVLEGILEMLPYASFSDAYGYLDRDTRNHEGITRHLIDVGSSGAPQRSSHAMADGIEGIRTLNGLDGTYRAVLLEDPSPRTIRTVFERVRRIDRLGRAFGMLITYDR